MSHNLTIALAAATAGVSAHTVRYYESEGLIPPVARDASGRRTFDADAVAWLEYAVCLRGLGMPVHAIAEYVTAASAASTPDDGHRRRAIMLNHLDDLKAKRRDLDAYIQTIERKLDTMGGDA